MGEVRVGLKIHSLKVEIYVIFSLFGPLVVMFDIFHDLFFWEMIPHIIKCNPCKFEANRLRLKQEGLGLK